MSNVDYISQFPVTAKLVKKPETDWEKERSVFTVHLEGPRLSFANLWHLDTQQDGELSKAFTSSVLIPLSDQNAPAIKLVDQVLEQCAKSMGTSYTKILGKQRRVKKVKADAVMMEDGVVVEDDHGNPKPVYNRGHMIINTSNSAFPKIKGAQQLTKWPIRYFSTAGKPVAIVPNDDKDDVVNPFKPPVDPVTGLTAQEMVGTGNNVRVRLEFSNGKDSYNGNKPKVFVNMKMVQFFHEDEKFSNGSFEEDAGDDFGAVDAPTGMDSFDTEIPPGNPAAEPAAAEAEDDLFSDDELDMFS